MSIEIVNEPAPGPRATGRVQGSVVVRLIDSKTGKQVGSSEARLKENERRPRETPKY